MKTLVIDVGGTHVKCLLSGEETPRKFDSGPELTPGNMVAKVRALTEDWAFSRVSIGFPGVVTHGRVVFEPHNLGEGWVGFDFGSAFGRPVKLVNDAAMQALGSYEGGRMLFLGLGTGLGSAMVVDGMLEPLELAHLPYRHGKSYEDYLGADGLERLGKKRWRKHVWRVVDMLRHGLEPESVVIGGGNAKLLEDPPEGVRLGSNANAFAGGFRLWDDTEEPTREETMKIGMIGLGRMGANMARRLIAGGHACVVHDRSSDAIDALASSGAIPAHTLDALVQALEPPRAVWLMVPSGVVDAAIADLVPHLQPGDTIIDGGNSYYVDDIRRAKALQPHGIHYLDVGTSGGVWGLERGYCLMIGGEPGPVEQLMPVFATLAPGIDAAPRTPARGEKKGTAERGFLHCGGTGAGHFVKMVHNGIEYGLMAAYAEGLNVLRHANAGKQGRDADAETTPLRDPEHYQYDFDLAEITEVWRRGSVIASWLLDLTAGALAEAPELSSFQGRVSDSGEGRWTLKAAIDESVPAPVLSTALYQRFSSRGEADFADRVLSAMRAAFGGHAEKS